jgi:hypothetical protein
MKKCAKLISVFTSHRKIYEDSTAMMLIPVWPTQIIEIKKKWQTGVDENKSEMPNEPLKKCNVYMSHTAAKRTAMWGTPL